MSDEDQIYFQRVKSKLEILISKRDSIKAAYFKLVADCDNLNAVLESMKKANLIIDEDNSITEIVEEPKPEVNKASFMDTIKEFYKENDNATVSQMEKYLINKGVEHGNGVTTMKKKVTDYLGILVRKGELVSEKVEGITYYKKKPQS